MHGSSTSWLHVRSFSFPPEALESVHRDPTAGESMVYVVDNSLKTHSHESRKNCRPARAKSSLTLRVKQHRREREINARIDKSTKDCRCRNSWHKRRRNAWRGPNCRCRNSWPGRRRNDSGTTIRRPRTCDRESVTKCRTREKGDNRDRWQHEDVLDSSIYLPPRYPAALPAVGPIRMHTTLSPCSLLPSGCTGRPPMWESNGGEDSSSS